MWKNVSQWQRQQLQPRRLTNGSVFLANSRCTNARSLSATCNPTTVICKMSGGNATHLSHAFSKKVTKHTCLVHLIAPCMPLGTLTPPYMGQLTSAQQRAVAVASEVSQVDIFR